MAERCVPEKRGGITPADTALSGGKPETYALVCLHPTRQAALQAILDVEERKNNRYSGFYPYAWAFFRRLIGNGKVTGRALNAISGFCWRPRERLTTLKDFEMAINTLIHTRGEYCPHPLPGDMRHTLFPEVEFNRMERARHRAVMRVDKHSA